MSSHSAAPGLLRFALKFTLKKIQLVSNKPRLFYCTQNCTQQYIAAQTLAEYSVSSLVHVRRRTLSRRPAKCDKFAQRIINVKKMLIHCEIL